MGRKQPASQCVSCHGNNYFSLSKSKPVSFLARFADVSPILGCNYYCSCSRNVVKKPRKQNCSNTNAEFRLTDLAKYLYALVLLCSALQLEIGSTYKDTGNGQVSRLCKGESEHVWLQVTHVSGVVGKKPADEKQIKSIHNSTSWIIFEKKVRMTIAIETPVHQPFPLNCIHRISPATFRRNPPHQ